jgi:hypothetical protein
MNVGWRLSFLITRAYRHSNQRVKKAKEELESKVDTSFQARRVGPDMSSYLSWRASKCEAEYRVAYVGRVFQPLSMPSASAHGAEVGFGVGADVGEARGIGHVRGLAGFGVGPALALLEFRGVIVEKLVDGDGGQDDST